MRMLENLFGRGLLQIAAWYGAQQHIFEPIPGVRVGVGTCGRVL